MGRMLGAFDDSDSIDRLDLNKCPDCACFFAQDECPLCGKVCPEDMRAGTRKPEKKKKNNGYYSGKVTFVEWNHSCWFILITLFIFPFVSVILASTAPYKKPFKPILIAVTVIMTVLTYTGLGSFVYYSLSDLTDPQPVNTELSREEYETECVLTDGEAFYRNSDTYKGDYVCVELKVTKIIAGYPFTDSAEHGYSTLYVCQKPDASAFTVLVQNCLIGTQPNLAVGDTVTFYGQGAGTLTVYDETDPQYTTYSMPALYAAYLTIETD